MAYLHGYSGGYSDAVHPTRGRTSLAQLQRNGSRLHVAEIGRGGRTGFKTGDESWERASGVFAYDASDPLDGKEAAMTAVAAAWAANSGADQATLTAALNQALDDYGFRRRDDTTLT